MMKSLLSLSVVNSYFYLLSTLRVTVSSENLSGCVVTYPRLAASPITRKNLKSLLCGPPGADLQPTREMSMLPTRSRGGRTALLWMEGEEWAHPGLRRRSRV